MDLATLANELDEAERKKMAEGSENPENDEEYRKFLERPSANMDDTGFFSLQVSIDPPGRPRPIDDH